MITRSPSVKFIEHNQPDEFIEVFKMQKKASGGNIDE
jgi:hypothetical protein